MGRGLEPSLEAERRRLMLSAFDEYRQKRYAEAISSYDKALELRPRDATALLLRGEAKKRLGRYEKALEDFDEALRLEPEDFCALRCWAAAKCSTL